MVNYQARNIFNLTSINEIRNVTRSYNFYITDSHNNIETSHSVVITSFYSEQKKL